MYKFYFFILSFIIATQFSFAQDFHLSQIDKTIAMINPALTGNYEGFEKLSLQHRSQWIGSGTQFTTSYGMAEFSFGKNERLNKAYAGLGVFFTNDVGGDSKISLKSGGLSLSGNLPLSRRQSISAGIQTSFNNRSADFSNLLFYSQWNGTQLDPSVNSGELNDYQAYSYLDAGAGIAYNYKDKSSNTLGGESFDFQIGASFMHLNRPNIRFATFVNDNLFIKTCLHSNLRYGITDRSAIELSVAQFFQGKHRETNVGVFYRARLREASRSTSLVNVKYITVGSYGRLTGVLTPYLSIDLGAFKLGMSYDVELGKISRAYKQSAEVSLSFLIAEKSIFRGNKLR
jgi:type IX secretion system PorP/SprF family membrane protein